MKNSKPKPHKYLHIETISGQLYVYRSAWKFRAKLVKPEELDLECRVDDNNICLLLKDLKNESI